MASEEPLENSQEPRERMPSCSGISVDREGNWYYQEDRITREDVLELFLSNLCLAPDGSYCIDWRGQRCGLEVADTPFIVSRIDRQSSEHGKREELVIRLKHLPDPEILDLSTLEVGEGNVPYCSIRNGQFRARFSRPAYYQLASWIEQDPGTGSFYLELNGRRFKINFASHRPTQDADHE